MTAIEDFRRHNRHIWLNWHVQATYNRSIAAVGSHSVNGKSGKPAQVFIELADST